MQVDKLQTEFDKFIEGKRAVLAKEKRKRDEAEKKIKDIEREIAAKTEEFDRKINNVKVLSPLDVFLSKGCKVSCAGCDTRPQTKHWTECPGCEKVFCPKCKAKMHKHAFDDHLASMGGQKRHREDVDDDEEGTVDPVPTSSPKRARTK